jgi:FlaA1/EpsC-like NDP-sugar epimerase
MHLPFFNKNKDRVTDRWLVLLIDISLVLQTFFVAYIVRFNFTLDFGAFQFIQQLPLVAIISLISFYMIGSYKGIIRHTGTRDAFIIFLASVLLAVFLGLIVFLNRQFDVLKTFTIPLSIIAIHFMLNVIVLIASRFIYKHVYYSLTKGFNTNKKVLIYGAGDSGMITYTAIKNDHKSAVEVIGFIDDNRTKVGKKYDRVSVFPFNKIDTRFIEKKNIKEIIVSIQNIASSDLLEIVNKITELPVKIKIVPPVEQWIDGTLKASQIKDIKIEDLLNRKPIQLDNPIVKEEIRNKVILITGAAGSIGSEIANQISHYPYKKLILVDQAESPLYDIQQKLNQRKTENFECIVADVKNLERMKDLFNKYNFQIIYHAAAYKHVPLMEENPYEAILVNILGSKNIMDLSLDNQVEKFVMISTDKAVNPTNVMGTTKRVAEMYAGYCATKKKTQFITTRFGNVLGSNGSVIPLFKRQIANGGPLTLTHKEITRYFMTIPEACELVLEAGSMGKGGEVFVFDMGQSVKIYNLAIKMIQLSGFKYPSEIDIQIIGLRPGEKLYEELLNDKEKTKPTHHKKIMIAKVASINENKLLKTLDNLQTNKYTNIELVKQLKNLVPEFISNNSIYSQLD